VNAEIAEMQKKLLRYNGEWTEETSSRHDILNLQNYYVFTVLHSQENAQKLILAVAMETSS
jgi:hypothetical protein